MPWPASPVMRRATGFHDDLAHPAVGKPAFELRPARSGALDNAPALVGDRDLESVLGQIDSHHGQASSSIHLGLPLGCTVAHTT